MAYEAAPSPQRADHASAASQSPSMKKKIFVLDTNVLLHDPTSLFRFEEHDLFIPMVVLEELDAAKKGTSEISRNARFRLRVAVARVEAGEFSIADLPDH